MKNSEIKQKFEKLKTKIRDRLYAELDDSERVISSLQEQIEREIHERNDLKHQLELKDSQIRELVSTKSLLTAMASLIDVHEPPQPGHWNLPNQGTAAMLKLVVLSFSFTMTSSCVPGKQRNRRR